MGWGHGLGPLVAADLEVLCQRLCLSPERCAVLGGGAGKCSGSVHPGENSKFKLRLNSEHPLLGPCWQFGDFVCEFLL